MFLNYDSLGTNIFPKANERSRESLISLDRPLNLSQRQPEVVPESPDGRVLGAEKDGRIRTEELLRTTAELAVEVNPTKTSPYDASSYQGPLCL